jgi:hypothetical protein
VQLLNVHEFGAIGDGVADDTNAIQGAIKYCFDNNINFLKFENGKVYLCNKELVLYGKNLSINGNDSVIKRTTGFVGVFGAVLNIYGLTPNLSYPLLGKYTGEVIAAENITIRDLSIYCSEDILSSTYINGLAVCNSKNIILKNIKVINAPQTAYAIVSSSVNNKDLIIDNVLLDSCISQNSKKHSYRLSSIKESKVFGAMMVNCSAMNVIEREVGYNAKDRKVHLLCNVSSNNAGNYKILIDSCDFDDSGEVYIVQNCTNVIIQNSQLMGGLEIYNPNSMISNNIVIQNNEFNYGTDNNAYKVPLLLYNIKDINIVGNVFTNTFKDMIGVCNIYVYSCEDIIFDKNYNTNLLISKANKRDSDNKNIIISSSY